MSNILIIKHGSLGDIAQISGVLKDIRENYRSDEIFILTTLPYVELLSKCPYIDRVLVDKRLPRWNIFYLLKLNKLLSKFKFSHVFDLQNSSRTSFYRKFLFKNIEWSSTKTTLPKGKKKADFDKDSVLSRFDIQLKNSGIKTKYTLNPDFSWAVVDVDNIINQYFGKKFILLFPFSSPQLIHKQWPYYNELIEDIKKNFKNIDIVFAPGPDELQNIKKINAKAILFNNRALNIIELAGLIKKADFIIANDTGPAHMSAHLNKSGVVLFGEHTTPDKVSIETEKFVAIKSKNLKELSSKQVFSEIFEKLKIIFN